MRILVVCKALDRPESFILRGLQDLGDSVIVLGSDENSHSAMLREAGVDVRPFKLSSRLDLLGILRLRRFVRDWKPDVIYALSNAGLSAANVGLIGTGVPVVTYRGTVGHLSWWDPSSWLTFLNPRVSKIVCVSQAVEQHLMELGLPAERVVTIYKGHDISWYSAPPPCSRLDLGVPESAFVVGCTAVIRAVKGVDDLITACASLLNEIPSLHLLLIGSVKDPVVASLISSFPEPKRIHVTGFRDDATRLATLCDVAVMASKSREGFPKSVVEAMSQGVPAIVTTVGGMPELVGHGEAGIMVPPSDPSALAAAIRELASSRERRTALGLAGKRRIETAFNIRQSVGGMQALFSQLAHSGQREALSS